MLVHELVYQGDIADVAFWTPEPVTYGQLQAEILNFRKYFHPH